MSTGRRRAERVKAPTGTPWFRRAPVCLLGALLAGVAWLVLVRAAIVFGRAARNGNGAAGWVFTAAASLGAVLCLMLVLTLLSRAWSALAVHSDYQPKRRR